MILRLPLLFLAGMLVGWWLAGSPSPAPELSKNAAADGRTTSGVPLPPPSPGSPLTGPRRVHRHVAISSHDLSETLRKRESTGLHLEDLDLPAASKIDHIGERIGLPDEDRKTLARILKEAANERREWEKQNVKIDTLGSAHWKFRFPGDHGASLANMNSRLVSSFGPEIADAIHLTADLGNFFTLGSYHVSPLPGHGEVEIRTLRTDAEERHPDPEGDYLTFHLRIGDSESIRTTKIDYLGESGFRFLHLLGGIDQLLEAATQASRP